MRRIRLLSAADAGWRLRLLTAAFAIAAAMSVAAVKPATGVGARPGCSASRGPIGAWHHASEGGTARVGPGPGHAARRGGEAGGQAGRCGRAPGLSCGRRRDPGRTGQGSLAGGRAQEPTVKAAAESQRPAAQVTRSATPGLELAMAATAGLRTPDSTRCGTTTATTPSCADWSGGDATNGVNLGGGSVAWFFSDSYLGSPAARKTLFYRSSLRNSIVIQNGTSLRTITGWQHMPGEEHQPVIPGPGCEHSRVASDASSGDLLDRRSDARRV